MKSNRGAGGTHDFRQARKVPEDGTSGSANRRLLHLLTLILVAVPAELTLAYERQHVAVGACKLALYDALASRAGTSFHSIAVSAQGQSTVSAFSPQSSDPCSSGEAWVREVEKLIESGKLEKAREKLRQQKIACGDRYATFFIEAKILFREGRYRESLKLLERCLVSSQTDPEVYKLVGLNAILIDRMDIAERALKSAVQLAPDDYLACFHLGALHYTDSRFPSARPLLEKSVSLNPDFIPARLFLGLTLEELDQEQDAIGCYQKAIDMAERLNFKGEQPYFYMARLLYRLNRMNESVPYLRKAIQANPKSCEALCLLSRIFSSQGQDGDSIKYLHQCVQADPNCAEAHYLLSRIYTKQGQVEEAGQELALFRDLKRKEKNRVDPRRNQRASP